MFGDEAGLWWSTPPRIARGAGPRQLKFDASAITVESSWTAPSEYPDLDGPVAIDLETEDPGLGPQGIGPSWAFKGEGRIVGVAVAVADAEWYFPTQHEGGGNLDHGQTMRWLQYQLRKPTLKPIMANAPYDLGWLQEREGIKFATPNRIEDIQVQMTILDENRFEYGLDAIGRDLLGIGKDESLMEKAIQQAGAPTKMMKQLMHRLPPRYVGPYGERDARLTFDVWKNLRAELEEEKLVPIYQLEQSMIPIAVGMRARGVRTNPDEAERVREELQTKEKDLIAEIKRRTGISIDPWSGESIARALRTEGIDVPKTKTGKDSITKEWLGACPSPTAKDVRQIRIYNKARTTFIDGHILGHAKNGRIHCQFHQLRGEDDEGGGRGTITGRWSSSDPNLQQIPKRNPEIQKLVRRLLLPDEGQEWAALDYSSQEPRLIVHFAALSGVPGGIAAMQRYIDNPRTDYHQMVADFCGIKRDDAKPINLGIGYGMGGAKLCRELGLPTEWVLAGAWDHPVNPEEITDPDERKRLVEIAGPEGKDLLDKYHTGAPFIKGMIEKAQKRGAQRGYITTLLGRRGRFPIPPGGGSRLGVHAALNKLAQGSAADQTKEAMRILWEDHGIMPLLTMHDELGLSVDTYKEARFAADVMELAVQLKVPSIVDVKMGDSWGSVKDRDPTPSMGRGTTARHLMAA